MSSAEQIVIVTNSSAEVLAPAVLAVLEGAGALGVEVGTRQSDLADAICKMYGVSRDEPRQRGDRFGSQPDYNIEFAVTYLVKLGAVRKAGRVRFITEEGRDLLTRPLAEIHKLVAAQHSRKKKLR